MSLFGELKRRNVFRVGAAYLVSSWLLIEIADIMFPAFGFPQGALKWLVGALVLGLIPLLLFSWAYELTDHGIVRDKGPGRENPQNEVTAHRLDQITIIMILLALAVVVVERFVLPQRVAEPPMAAVETRPAEPAAQAPVEAPPPQPVIDRPIPDGPSVAVLPFTNMSPDPENEYFADGISEEILNVLAAIDGLKVASRTSAFSFKGTSTPIPQIARQLGVAHVLEGSVRRAGNRVRITAQLIDAANDQHLWSDAYDRDLTDIFAVQEEIAKAIAVALQHEFGFESSRVVTVSAPTQDLKAYELYLEGRTLFYQRGDALLQARANLEQAVGRDPQFAEAWATLAATLHVSPSYRLELDPVETARLAEQAAERARALDDSLAVPYAVLGAIKGESDGIQGERLLTAAIERNPNDSTAWLWRGILLARAGRVRGSLEDFRRAQEIDPGVGITNGWLGSALMDAGRFDEAEHYVQRSLALGWRAGSWYLGHLGLARGDLQAANQHFGHWMSSIEASLSSGDVNRQVAGLIKDAVGDPGRVADIAGRVLDGRLPVGQSGWGGVVLSLGAPKAAIALERSPSLAVDSTFFQNVWHPGVRAIAEDPEFVILAEEHGLMAYWEAAGFPDGCRLVETPERRLECDW
jgi:TolB-like protein